VAQNLRQLMKVKKVINIIFTIVIGLITQIEFSQTEYAVKVVGSDNTNISNYKEYLPKTFSTHHTKWGQNKKDKSGLKTEQTNCYDALYGSITSEQAEIDWKKGKAKFYIDTGFLTPVKSLADSTFENKYGVEYIFINCFPINEDCLYTYNRKIGELLDIKFGKQWHKEVNNNVILTPNVR